MKCGKTHRYYLIQGLKIYSSNIETVIIYLGMWCTVENTGFPFVVSLLNNMNLIMEKHLKLKFPWNNWLILFKGKNIKEKKEGLSNLSRLKETKEHDSMWLIILEKFLEMSLSGLLKTTSKLCKEVMSIRGCITNATHFMKLETFGILLTGGNLKHTRLQKGRTKRSKEIYLEELTIFQELNIPSIIVGSWDVVCENSQLFVSLLNASGYTAFAHRILGI